MTVFHQINYGSLHIMVAIFSTAMFKKKKNPVLLC